MNFKPDIDNFLIENYYKDDVFICSKRPQFDINMNYIAHVYVNRGELVEKSVIHEADKMILTHDSFSLYAAMHEYCKNLTKM